MGRITVYLNDEIEEEIEEESQEKGVSKSKLLRNSLEEHYEYNEIKNELNEKDQEINKLKNKINTLENENRTLEGRIESKEASIELKDETINTLQTQLSIMKARNIDSIKNKANPLSRFFLAMALGFSGVDVGEPESKDEN